MVSETIEITPEDIFGLIALSGDAKASYHHAMLLMQEGKAEEAAEAVKAGDATLKEARYRLHVNPYFLHKMGMKKRTRDLALACV